MAVPLLQTIDAAEVIAQLRKARGRPDEAVLRQAVTGAAEIAPAVIALAGKVANDVCLTPNQSNLLFWGSYVLGAGRRKEFCQPLLHMLHSANRQALDDIYGDFISECLKYVTISVFDGNAEALTAVLADPNVDGFVRWGLFEALARLTFDGLIPRAQTLALLERFDRELLAEPLDPAWEGWLEAVVYLGFEELDDRLRRAWRDGRFDESIADFDYWEQQIAMVRGMRPGDPGMFDRQRLTPITDIGKVVSVLQSNADVAKNDAKRGENDPAAAIVPAYERAWLEDFLSSKHVPDTAMTMDALDGYFTALAVCPSATERSAWRSAVWNHDFASDARPCYDNDEQEEYAETLLDRYLEAVKRRVASGRPHPPDVLGWHEEGQARQWASGIIRAVALQAELWRERVQVDKDTGAFLGMTYALGSGTFTGSQERVTRRHRKAFFAQLPSILERLYRGWRGLAPLHPAVTGYSVGEALAARQPDRKVGRNERCPCGSGKKYKRCCGAAS
jgi:uncharacterized protein